MARKPCLARNRRPDKALARVALASYLKLPDRRCPAILNGDSRDLSAFPALYFPILPRSRTCASVPRPRPAAAWASRSPREFPGSGPSGGLAAGRDPRVRRILQAGFDQWIERWLLAIAGACSRPTSRRARRAQNSVWWAAITRETSWPRRQRACTTLQTAT